MISLLLVSPSPSIQKEAVLAKLKGLNLDPLNPAVFWLEPIKEANISLKETLKLKDHFLLKSWSDNPQIGVISSAEKLTIDAQNALLKILEEPPALAQLILTTTSTDQLLPTIISRCQTEIITSQQFNNLTIQQSQTIQKLLAANLEERFSIIEKTEDKLELLLELESYFSKQLKDQPQTIQVLKDILQAKEWVGQNGNIRAILEWLMLSI